MTQIINWEYFSEEICYIKKALKLLVLINCIVLKTLCRLIKYFKYEEIKKWGYWGITGLNLGLLPCCFPCTS